MDIRRVVDIRFNDPASFGSGYLLTDRLVLTAKHVAEGHAVGDACTVRRLLNVAAELDGVLKWRSPLRDAAVLELTEEADLGELGPQPRFGRIINPAQKRYPCQAIGFPRAMKDGGSRDDWTLDGSAFIAFRAAAFDITPTTALPVQADGWRGFSGAAVFSGGLLAAIVESIPEGFGAAAVRAIPAAPLLDEPPFQALLAAAGARVESLVSTLRPDDYYDELARTLRPLYCYVDRAPQVEQVVRTLAPLSKSQPPPGHGFLVIGREDDQPRLFIERMARQEELARLVGDVEPDRAIVRLDWPKSVTLDAPETEFDRLKAQAASLLDLPESATQDAAAFRKALEERDRAAAIWWSIDYDSAGPGHAALLELWTEFCTESSGGQLPLLWFVCVLLPMETVARPAQQDSLFSPPRVEPDPRLREVLNLRIAAKTLRKLDNLPQIDPDDDLDPWLDQVRRLRRDLGVDDRADLKCRIEEQLVGASKLALRPFTDAVSRSLRQGR